MAMTPDDRDARHSYFQMRLTVEERDELDFLARHMRMPRSIVLRELVRRAVAKIREGSAPQSGS